VIRSIPHGAKKAWKFRSTDISGNYADFAKALGSWGSA
jgi:hypothetical protein